MTLQGEYIRQLQDEVSIQSGLNIGEHSISVTWTDFNWIVRCTTCDIKHTVTLSKGGPDHIRTAKRYIFAKLKHTPCERRTLP